jgi:YesN/AraC family two-component response regulator
MDCRNLRILFVYEEKNSCDLLLEELKARGCDCQMSFSAEEALAKLKEDRFNITVLDINLREKGIVLIKKIKVFCPKIAIIVTSVISDLDFAVEVMKAGALDYVIKPINNKRIDNALGFVIEKLNKIAGSGNCVLDTTIANIEAVALGVEARQEILDVHTEKIIFQTINTARKMGFTEEKIQKWVSTRSELKARKSRIIIDSILQFANSSIPEHV